MDLKGVRHVATQFPPFLKMEMNPQMDVSFN